MQIQLKIITPEKIIYESDVDYVRLEAKDGSFGVLPSHAPLAAQLNKGPVRVTIGKKEEFVDINGGFARVLPQSITIFTH